MTRKFCLVFIRDNVFVYGDVAHPKNATNLINW